MGKKLFEELKVTKNKLTSALSENEAKMGSITKTHEELVDVQAQLTEAQEEIVEKDQQLLSQEKLLTESRESLTKARSELKRRDTEIKLKIEEVQTFTSNFETAKEDLVKEDVQLKHKDVKLMEIGNQLQKAVEETKKREEALSKKEAELTKMQKQLVSAKEELSKKEQMLKEKENELTKRLADLHNVQTELEETIRKSGEKDDELEKLRDELGNSQPTDGTPGFVKCDRTDCEMCQFVTPTASVKSTVTGQQVNINCRVDCQSKHLVYLITCTKCKKQFVSQTHRSMAEAFAEHLKIVNNRITNQPSGRHFTLPGHNSSHMQIAAIEKVFNKSKDALKVRESEWIKEFGTLVPRGMNIKS